MENFCTLTGALNAKQYSLPLELNTVERCNLPFDEISPRKTTTFNPCYYCKKLVLD